MDKVSHLTLFVKRLFGEMLGNVTIWTAIILSTILVLWMMTWGWAAVPGEPRTGPTVPDFVNPRVLESP